METDFGEAILCNLCEESITMKEARHLGAIKIEKQAKKILQDSKIKIPTFKVGDCVVIPVPKVDKGPVYPANVIGVVIDQKNKLNRLGTEHGILKVWYGSGNIQPATYNFIDFEQANKTKEISKEKLYLL
uniref:Uncharacterized protein n=1 Tax=Sipha flava TaxID=143950 RepID=A0A2S2QEH3_9HEMI